MSRKGNVNWSPADREGLAAANSQAEIQRRIDKLAKEKGVSPLDAVAEGFTLINTVSNGY